MEHYDDDISIIASDSENTDDIDGFINPSSTYIPELIFPSTVPCNTTALYALQTAYSDLKKRYNHVALKNQNLSRALRDVEKINNSKMSSYNDVNFPMSYNAQGAAAMAESTPELAAQEGYIRGLQRELNIAKIQLQKFDSVKKSYEQRIEMMEDKYKEVVEEDSQKEREIMMLEQRLGEFNMENQNLNEKLKAYKMQKEEAMLNIGQGQGHTCNQDDDLNLKVKELEQECARLHMDEEIRRSAMLEKDKETESLQRRVAELEAELKSSRGQLESLSLASIPANEELMFLKQIIGGLKGSVLQQNEFLRNFVKSSSLKNGTTGLHGKRNTLEKSVDRFNDNIDSAHLVSNNKMMSPRRHVVGKSLSQGGIVEDSSLLKVSLPPQKLQGSERIHSISLLQQGEPSERIHLSPSRQVSKSDIVRIQPIRAQAQTDLSNSEVFSCRTSHTDIDQSNVHGPSGESWFEVNNLDSAYDNTSRPQKPVNLLNQSKVSTQNLPQRHEISQRQNVTGYTSPQQYVQGHEGLQRQSAASYDLPQRQNGTGYDLPQRQNGSGYDFLHGRVLEQDILPEEHVDKNVTPERTNSSHVCPVCSVDFPEYTMNEFQTHVFECFDDSNAPETLQPEQDLINDKICPMCNALFPGTVPQIEFETHVQTHFEDGSATGFEILEP